MTKKMIPDGGMDGRHAPGDRKTILQAKHFAGSTYAALRSKMRRERLSIDRLAPTRYVLATSRALSPQNKEELAEIIGPTLLSEADIIGPDDLNALLRKYPDIERSHLKLWLTGYAVLDRVIRAAAHAFKDITKHEIEEKLRVYAPNPSFDEARETLERNHVVIISGPPGVGKSTLAEILSYAYTAEAWELVPIRNLDDGLASIIDTRKQIFLFDDFLGKVALDQRALAHKDSDLARFIRRISTSPNARFILTTRAYIFEEARRVSEHLADPRLEMSKYILDVGVYTRRIKARILYNHLLIAGTPQPHIAALVKGDTLVKLVDHRNYSPRIIEWMTDTSHVGSLTPAAYPTAFIHALNHPKRLWDIAFRTHISKPCQHLLFSLFFSSQYGVTIDKLRFAYAGLHPHLCAKFGEPHDPKDFEEALRILEGGFVSLRGGHVHFVNPSLRDFLSEYLTDPMLLRDFAIASRQPSWAKAVWQHGRLLKLSDEEMQPFALCFIRIAELFVDLPTWERVEGGRAPSVIALSNTDRIELLLDWWNASHDERFSHLALALARAPVDGLSPWLDGREAIGLLGKLRDGDYFYGLPYASEMAESLEEAVLGMIDQCYADDLENISDATGEWRHVLGDRIRNAVEGAIRTEIDQVRDIVADIDSESTLTDHIATLKKLGERVAVPAALLEKAVATVMERIGEVEEKTSVSASPSFKASSSGDSDAFDDVALRNLFEPLLN